MRRPLLIAAAAMLLVIVGLGVAVVVLDNKAEGKIADGVKVGSVDVGGMKAEQAKAKVRKQLLAPLDDPVVVRYHGETWKLTAAKAKIRADVDGMVAEAMKRSEGGNAVQRAWREATGGEVKATIPAEVTYSRRAVNKLVKRIAAHVQRDPKDASVTFSSTSLGEVKGKDGVALKAAVLRRQINDSITTPGAKRTFRARTKDVKPEITTDELAEKYPVVLTVERGSFKLHLWKNLKLTKTYDIRVGQQGLETPAGLYHIQNKAVDPAWSVPHSAWTGSLAGQVIPGGAPNNPLKARWMGIFDGAGIHGIDPSAYGTIGTAASHGCVGMRIPDVEELYDQVPVGAPIYIA
ncbi:L,D-transpeptidase family protein [Capillimicrobium parvum]|nr:L,D-transpeptidase family protein [Capillimicrobium parvum]